MPMRVTKESSWMMHMPDRLKIKVELNYLHNLLASLHEGARRI
jgi:hypothetical protein